MLDLLELHKSLLTPHIKQGGIAVDFTAGTGADTLWLARSVGPQGRVYSFDIQETALLRTHDRLVSENMADNVTLVFDSHANARLYVQNPICAGMFNLGYLPGGDHAITTMRESTRPAVEAALALLDDGGALLIAVYPGHPEGAAEGEMIGSMLSELNKRLFMCTKFQIINSAGSPFFYFVEKGSRWPRKN